MRGMANSRLLTQAVLTSFEGFQELADRTLARYRITASTEWTPIDAVTSSLYFVEEKIGKDTTRKIGRSVSYFAAGRGPKAAASVDEMLMTLNGLYLSNHLHLKASIGLAREAEGYLVRFGGNPYPFSFNRGLIEGFLLQTKLPHAVQACEEENAVYLLKPQKNS